MSNICDDKYLSYRAFDADTTSERIDVSAVSASTSLAPGGYYAVLVDAAGGCGYAFLRHGAAAVIPASGADGAGYVVAAGSAVTFRLTSTTTMHAITAAGTGTLFFIKTT